MKLFVVSAACVLAVVLGACGATQDTQGGSAKNTADLDKPAAAVTKLTILAPADASTVRIDHVVVRGTVIPVGAHVIVMGKPATVTDGLFTATAAMAMGANNIDVSATSRDADPVTTMVHVTRGRTDAQLARAAAAKARSRARAAAARKAKAARAAARRAARANKPAASSSGNSSDCIVVPNVVGKNHQAGQDTMQAAGLYSLDEEDSTGRGRLLLFDRNWVNTAQSPAAGECVSPDATVMLSAKKIGE